ncbi:MAG: hypothetical protein KC478_01000, partial [Bacteriovoracaceae bacterium]|nr:hypothetical protein [Bacteriovoracaceae bacterium]
MVKSIGEKASADSKERGKQSFNFQREKAKYRLAAKEFLNGCGVDRLIAGHTHIADDYEWEEKGYHNVGYPPKDKVFLKLDKDGVERVLI